MGRKIIKIKSVIFDMDGVITHTMPYHFKAWHEVLLKEGVDVTHNDIYCREGQPGKISIKELFEKYGKKYDAKAAKRILHNKEILFNKIMKQRFVVGSRSFIKGLRRMGISLALVTGTSRIELHRILPDRIYNLFDVVVTGNDVKHGKPHPEPFLKATQNIRCSKKDMIVLENAPFGIRSAKKAGLKCIAIETSLPKQYLNEADYVVHSFKHLNDSMQFKRAS